MTVYGIPKTIPIPEDHPTEPLCSYGIQKLAIEKYLRLYYHLYGLDYAIMRISNPSRPFDVPVNVLDITRANEMLKWKPEIGIEEGLQMTMNYLMSLR